MDLSLENFFSLHDIPFAHVFKDVTSVLEIKKSVTDYFRDYSRRQVQGNVHRDAIVDGLVIVEPGAEIAAGALIEGPAWICCGAQIRHGAYIRDNSIIGPFTKIGHASEVARSVFLARARALHFAFVGDSVIGNDVNIGSSCVFANLRIDSAVTEPAKHNIVINLGATKVDSGYTKFGAVIGDRSRTGAHISISPGTLVGKEVVLHTRAQIGGIYPTKSWAR